MFGLFKSKREKLEEKYTRLMNESHRLSIINRAKSDQKFAEAQEVMVNIENLDKVD